MKEPGESCQADTGSPQPREFSVRIVSIDYYMAPPIPGFDISYSSFHGGKMNEVPVIRIYGSTPAGQKTCLHIHQILPYLYVPCSDLGPITNDEVDSRAYSISLALEKALQLKSNSASKRQHVHGSELVRARKFYGYHSTEELFVKIYFYYPQDVSRAANLLLAGAILDKSLQPYESHIPYLLQFLIDYNLYGMGHLHVSKMKFRPPVPDTYSQRKHKHNGKLRPSVDDSSCMDFQVELGGDPSPDTPIWTSSTIPDGWILPFSSQPSSSVGEDIQLFKRLSTSELEADAVAHDILNQKFTSYARLSQTHSEMKMVQSLIPIWEEEYERHGVTEVILLDPEKPSPKDVLRKLSDGVQFENFIEMRNSTGDWSLLTPVSVESSPAIGDSADSGVPNLEGSSPLLSNYLKASDNNQSIIPLASPLLKVDQTGTSENDAADQLSVSSSVGPSTPKDEDALRLLKWLASSQAVEDINSDDELAHEIILSPLLPSKSIDKVLERANVDYESESQKECQDILDSIDMIEEPETRAFKQPHHFIKQLPNKVLPQVDGSSDDLQSIPCSNESPKTEYGEGKSYVEAQSWLELDTGLVNGQQLKKPQWGSLPVFSRKRSKISDSDASCTLKEKEGLGASWIGNEPVTFSLTDKEDLRSPGQSSLVVECSTRDLMRRKRSGRIDVSGSRRLVKDWKGELCSDATRNVRGDSYETRKALTPPMHKPPVKNEEIKLLDQSINSTVEEFNKAIDVNTTDSFLPGESHMSPSKDDVSAENLPKNVISPSSGRDPSKSINEEAETLKLFGMTINKKPPKIDWKDECRSDTPVHGNRCSNIGTSLHGRFADDCLPFFVRKCQEEIQGVSPGSREHANSHEPIMGVPLHFQNDGSYLYMLTPVVSPPSREFVERWLSIDCSDILRQQIDSPFLPITERIADDVMDSQGSQADDKKSASLSNEKSMLNQLPEHNQVNFSPNGETAAETKSKLTTGISQGTSQSQISGPDKKMGLTSLSQSGFRDPASVGQGQQLTLLSIEVQAVSRGDSRPDPRFDAVNVIVLVLQEDDESMVETYVLLRSDSASVEKDFDAISDSKVFVFMEEIQLFNHFTKLIHSSEPDILMGWDVQSSSLGFLAERAAYLGIGLLNNISRAPCRVRASEKLMVNELLSETVSTEAVNLEKTFIEDEWGRTHASGVHVGGRIVLNIWRLMRNEVKVNMYSLEAVAEAVLRRKVPYIPWKVLTNWFSSGPGRARYRSINYTLERAKLNLQIMNQLDMINRTSELARVFGIDFFSVLSRGSQYRVESMFLRLAHTQNYLAISPGSQQVASQPAMECIPLVMEPESRFYADPVIVLDFQSLYPSMVIAYNLCYCTCLGKITPPMEQTLGVSSYLPGLSTLRKLKHELLVAPNGCAYVPFNVRKGILPRLLEEILSTRIMVKQAIKKLAPTQLVLRRILNARQLALKLIANVTYGYTAAGFSGRMPCAELADSIVQCGRRTLETAIAFVNSNDRWKARVVYGDTDSMFVLLKGRSLQEAFAVGQEIALEITKMNPSPVTLKMEKVYYPCFLLTKKRYVGYSYESPDQVRPTFDAKGIETIRRDTCAAVSKTMEQSLKIYFESQDINNVKAYVVRQWKKIISGRVSLQDFVFAKEVRLGAYAAHASSLPPAAIVATKAMRNDPRAEPRYADRIPYVVIHGEPGARLVDMVVDPLELVALNSPFRLNDTYYIRKQIMPALQRVFGLVGADMNQWFLDMPRPAREAVGKRHSFVQNPQRTRIDYYYVSKHCVLCGDLVQGTTHLCRNCCKNETAVSIVLTGRTSKLEKDIQHLTAICCHCGGGDWLIEPGVKCTSLTCSVFYERVKVVKELQSLSQVATSTGHYPKCMVEWF